MRPCKQCGSAIKNDGLRCPQCESETAVSDSEFQIETQVSPKDVARNRRRQRLSDSIQVALYIGGVVCILVYVLLRSTLDLPQTEMVSVLTGAIVGGVFAILDYRQSD